MQDSEQWQVTVTKWGILSHLGTLVVTTAFGSMLGSALGLVVPPRTAFFLSIFVLFLGLIARGIFDRLEREKDGNY